MPDNSLEILQNCDLSTKIYKMPVEMRFIAFKDRLEQY